jgi:hypothetical protein
MSVAQVIFGTKSFPRRIENDPTFNAWGRPLPRLWYLDQRQATRLDAESLFGASQYSILYSRTVELTLADPIETGAVGVLGHYQEAITVIAEPVETVTRTLTLTRATTTVLDPITETAFVLKASGGPVNPIVHPDEGANRY